MQQSWHAVTVAQHDDAVHTFTTNKTFNWVPSGSYGYCFRLSCQILPSHQGNSLGLSHSCFLVLWSCYHTVKYEFSEFIHPAGNYQQCTLYTIHQFSHSVAELLMAHPTHYHQFTHSEDQLPTLHPTHYPTIYLLSTPKGNTVSLSCLSTRLPLIGKNAINSELSIRHDYFHRNVPCPSPSCKNIPHIGQTLKASYLVCFIMLHFNTILQSKIRVFTKILLSVLVLPHLPKPHTSLLQM
jgi:hypothetical protein